MQLELLGGSSSPLSSCCSGCLQAPIPAAMQTNAQHTASPLQKPLEGCQVSVPHPRGQLLATKDNTFGTKLICQNNLRVFQLEMT